jgi:hypothetical protein
MDERRRTAGASDPRRPRLRTADCVGRSIIRMILMLAAGKYCSSTPRRLQWSCSDHPAATLAPSSEFSPDRGVPRRHDHWQPDRCRTAASCCPTIAFPDDEADRGCGGFPAVRARQGRAAARPAWTRSRVSARSYWGQGAEDLEQEFAVHGGRARQERASRSADGPGSRARRSSVDHWDHHPAARERCRVTGRR